MTLRSFLHEVGTTYDRLQGTGTPTARLLRDAPSHFASCVQGEYIIKGSAGTGTAAACPWVAFFDPDETVTARHGMYVVYLFAENMETVSLSLNHGVTELREKYGSAEANRKLEAEAGAIRGALSAEDCQDLDASIDLGGRPGLPQSYECGNVFARTYRVDDLPDEGVLCADLRRFIALYQDALAIREYLRQTTRDVIYTVRAEGTWLHEQNKDGLLHFAPKSDEEYVQTIESRRIVKTRKHETLVRDYGTHLHANGFEVGTNVHPRDIVARHESAHWLIEAKVVRQGNATHAVREALGQLATYSFLLYPPKEQPAQVALFTEGIGDVYVRLLEHHGIASVWRSATGWSGSPSAVAAGLAEPAVAGA
ncbi:MrcB family domain-containing protein [Kitasatospora sp. NPDC058444]|uniref:MrcB family domain-containing protein n=1 Tax=Kitasatospora sp. NPDC058444 TaxID=3346504 RepID=UPI003649C396